MSSQNMNNASKQPSKAAKKRSQAKPKGDANRNNNNNGKVIIPQSKVQSKFAPSNIGVQLPSSYFRVGSGVQKLTDRGEGIGIRLHGCDLFNVAIQADGSTKLAFNGTAVEALAPAKVSTRLSLFDELFQFYAFRRLTIWYTNDVGSSTAGSVAIGLYTNEELTAIDAPTSQQQILQLPYSCKTAVWEPCRVVDYVHTGTTTWSTNYGDGVVNNDYQANIGAIFNAVLSAATFGTLWIEYTIDFYQPCPVNATDPSIFARKAMRQAHRLNYIPDFVKNVNLLYEEFKNKDSNNNNSVSLLERKENSAKTLKSWF